MDITPQGIGTKYLSNLNIGEKLFFEGPFGHMILPKNFNEKKAINFIATGTGISPFLSVIKFLESEKYSGEINVLYSEKYEKDLYPLDQIKISNLHLTLTRDENSSHKKGRVTSHLDFLTFSYSQLYFLCGTTRMILEVKKLLINKGISEENIIFESFYY